MSESHPVVGIVLAGGKSSRMGTDKAHLSINGYSQLQFCRDLLLEAGCEQVLISRNQGDGICDIYTGQGPLAGLHAALQQLTKDSLVVAIPIDMPLLRHSEIKLLIEYTNRHKRACFFKQSFLPCAFLANAHSHREIEARLAQSQRSVKGFLFAQGAAALTASNQQNLINTNTPEQWLAAKQLCQSR